LWPNGNRSIVGINPSEKGCTLKISGTEQEVLDAAVQHAVSAHGHNDPKRVARAAQINAQRIERLSPKRIRQDLQD